MGWRDLKAWQIGAIVGAVIGLLKVSASVLFPIIGAVVGAVLFHSIYTFITTTKIKLWQKAGIIAVVYAAIVDIFEGFLALAGAPYPSPKFLYYLFALPLLTHIELFSFYLRFGDFSFLANLILWFAIGALIGYIYEKRRGLN
ncbi:MAG: hypothetical protein V3T58_07215 [Candidatus Hydrothermarchaeales archaeon]